MKPTAIQMERIRSTLLLQFPNLGVDEIVDQIDITVSRSTGRIRGIFDKNTEDRLFSLRTSDGRYLPTFLGAKRILNTGYQNNRVVMNADAAPFVAKCKSAFCKHVIRTDENVVPQGEVFLIDEKYNLLAVGTAQQPGYAMLELDSGIAVKVKHCRDKQ